MKKFFKVLVCAFSLLVFFGTSANALPIASDYWTLTDFTTGTSGETTTFNLGNPNFSGNFGLYTVDDIDNPTPTSIDLFQVFTFGTISYQQVFFNQTSTGWVVGLDDVWGNSDDQAFQSSFGFYFEDVNDIFYSDATLNTGGTESVYIDYTPYVATISLDINGNYASVSASDLTPVPEPGTLLLLGFGALGLIAWKRKKK